VDARGSELRWQVERRGVLEGLGLACEGGDGGGTFGVGDFGEMGYEDDEVSGEGGRDGGEVGEEGVDVGGENFSV
jgi:hypothetical protein